LSLVAKGTNTIGFVALVHTCQYWCIAWCYNAMASFVVLEAKQKKTSIAARCSGETVFVSCCFCSGSDAIGCAIGRWWRAIVAVFSEAKSEIQAFSQQ